MSLLKKCNIIMILTKIHMSQKKENKMTSFKNILNNFLFESTDNPKSIEMDLDKRYENDIELKDIEFKSSPGWYELDMIIHDLKKISKKNFISPDKISINDFLLSKGYNLLGSGAYRDVYSMSNCPWVIKVDKSLRGNYNTRELNIYFYKKMGTGTLGLYPKIYAWDNTVNKLRGKLIKDDQSPVRWIIFEKVVPIKTVSTLKSIFKPFYRDLDLYLNELIKIGLAEHSIFDYINDDPEYEKAAGYTTEDMNTMNWWKLIYDNLLQLKKFRRVSIRNMKKHFTDPSLYNLSQKENELFFSKGKVNDTNINTTFLKFLFKQIHQRYIESDVLERKFVNISFKICDDLGIFKSFSPDVAYIYKDFANDMWEDMHIKNLGYRPHILEKSLNSWESLAFLDFAEDY